MIILLSCLVFLLFLIVIKLTMLINKQELAFAVLERRINNHIYERELDLSFKVGGSL